MFKSFVKKVRNPIDGEQIGSRSSSESFSTNDNTKQRVDKNKPIEVDRGLDSILDTLTSIYTSIEPSKFNNIYNRRYSNIVLPTNIPTITRYITILELFIDNDSDFTAINAITRYDNKDVYLQDWFLVNGNYPTDIEKDMSNFIITVLKVISKIKKSKPSPHLELLCQSLLILGQKLNTI